MYCANHDRWLAELVDNQRSGFAWSGLLCGGWCGWRAARQGDFGGFWLRLMKHRSRMISVEFAPHPNENQSASPGDAKHGRAV
jgi:hypothetical protein